MVYGIESYGEELQSLIDIIHFLIFMVYYILI